MTISDILAEADEQVNIYTGAHDHAALRHLDVVFEAPEDWLAWMLYDADLHEEMANDARYPEFDRACFWQDAALLRKYASLLLLAGVRPTEFGW